MGRKLYFSKRWLSLTKKQFDIVFMLTVSGDFKGTQNDICRYFSLDAQTRTRRTFLNAIQQLKKQKLITADRNRNTITLSLVPEDKGNMIAIDEDQVNQLRSRPPSGRDSVAWENTLKVYLWACLNNYDDIITNQQIANDLNISVPVIVTAKKVLDDEFRGIQRQTVKIFQNDEYRNIGQHLAASAFFCK